MNTRRRQPLLWCLSIVAALLSLLPLWTSAAQAYPLACADGYALWASNQIHDDALWMSGSTITVSGSVHSNRDIRLSGSTNSITGTVEYVSLFRDEGDDNTYPAPIKVSVSPSPVHYPIEGYRPGGAAAVDAQAAGRYTQVQGDFEVAEPRVLDGLYYVAGNAKLSASNISGTFTVVAEGTIDVSGSYHQSSAYANGLLLLSNKTSVGASVVKLAGSNSTIQGVIAAPGGAIELSGSNNTIDGIIAGDTLKLNGSSLKIRFAQERCPTPEHPPAGELDAYIPGEVVVKLYSASDLAAVALAHGLEATPIDRFGTRPIFLLRILDGTDPLVKAEQLQPASGSGGDGRIEYAEPNYLAQTPEARRGRTSWVVGGGQSGYTQQWAPAMIRLSQAHTVSRGAGITVAVLDTGVDTAHPALAGRLTSGFDFVDFDPNPQEQGTYGVHPGFGHGTHVAGLVALAAPDALIMPVRVLDPDGVGNIWVLSEGLLYAAEIGPDGASLTGDEAQVINLSIGTLRRTSLLEDLIGEVACAGDDDDDDDIDDRCRNTGGAVVVAASGNGGNTIPQYPAAEAVAGMLAMNASTPDDTLAGFSTYGSWVRLAAPGDAIVSTVPGGGFGVWSGTSMATPLAAGVAALVRSHNASLSTVQVAELLVSTGSRISGPTPRRLDAAAALGLPPPRPLTFLVFVPNVSLPKA